MGPLSQLFHVLHATLNTGRERAWGQGQEYKIVGKEGEYPTSPWWCVTTLSRVHDLWSDICNQGGFIVVTVVVVF